MYENVVDITVCEYKKYKILQIEGEKISEVPQLGPKMSRRTGHHEQRNRHQCISVEA